MFKVRTGFSLFASSADVNYKDSLLLIVLLLYFETTFVLLILYCSEDEEKIDNLSRSLYLDTLMRKIKESQLSYEYERRFKNLKYMSIELLTTLKKDKDTWGKPGTTYVSNPALHLFSLCFACTSSLLKLFYYTHSFFQFPNAFLSFVGY